MKSQNHDHSSAAHFECLIEKTECRPKQSIQARSQTEQMQIITTQSISMFTCVSLLTFQLHILPKSNAILEWAHRFMCGVKGESLDVSQWWSFIWVLSE